MQLNPSDRGGGRARTGRRVGASALIASLVIATGAAADSGIGTTTTVFREAGGELDITVITPQAHASVDLGQSATLNAQWEADIVSGASVAVVDAPTAGVDVIASATKLEDVRHTVGGSLTFFGDQTSLTAGYSYGTENDYRSHSLSLSARAEMFERNTAFDVSYARGFDQVCNLAQPRAQDAVDRARMPDAEGCFVDESDRESLDLSLQTFQGGWTQAWTSVLTTQLTVTGQLLHGYQGNPYRAVWLGRSAAQEFHPENRARYAVGLRTNLWIRPLQGALKLALRGYRDSWSIESLTGEVAYEQSILDGLSLRGRARYYRQSGAAFYSDDYTRFPRGQYFTGDRELSPMSSLTLGGRVQWSVPPGEDGDVVGVFSALELVAKADIVFNNFNEFRYGSVAVPNATAAIGTVGAEATF